MTNKYDDVTIISWCYTVCEQGVRRCWLQDSGCWQFFGGCCREVRRDFE